MRRACISMLVATSLLASAAHPVAASESTRIRWRVWLQPALGAATGDDLVTSDVPATVSMTDIPLVGAVGVDMPVVARIELENPVGVMLGAELTYGRLGIEVTGAYVHDAAVGSGGVQVRGGLLTEEEWQLLDGFGITLPDIIVVEEQIPNLAVSLGINYHFVDRDRWDAWAGPMIVWSFWGEYDLSDVRIELIQSLEDLLQGQVSDLEISGYSSIAPEDALTFGASAGASFAFAGDWFLVGNVRYFMGDKVELPSSSADYGVLSFSVGVGVGFGG